MVPSAFANYLGGKLMPVKTKWVRNKLDDLNFPTAKVEDQFALLHEVVDLIRAGYLSVHLPKSDFCFPVVEWLGMIIDCDGTRPAPNKIDTISQLSRLTTGEDIRALLSISTVPGVRQMADGRSCTLGSAIPPRPLLGVLRMIIVVGVLPCRSQGGLYVQRTLPHQIRYLFGGVDFDW